MKEDPLAIESRKLAQTVLQSLVELVDEEYAEWSRQERLAMVLMVVQINLADSLMAVSTDRAHALRGLDLMLKQIRLNIEIFYDHKERQ